MRRIADVGDVWKLTNATNVSKIPDLAYLLKPRKVG